MDDLTAIGASGKEEVASCKSLVELEALRVKYLGKKGLVSMQMQQLGQMAPDAKKDFGAKVNKIKEEITQALDAKKQQLEEVAIAEKLASERVDISLPIRPDDDDVGMIHPISQVIDEAIAIFAAQGFMVAEGPEIEDDFHNFNALNIPPNHPARQMQDTFYLNAKKDEQHMLLRTHTSSVQIRTMLNGKPPFKFIAPGRVFRSDYDMTHTPMFHQIEGLYIDKSINMGHLKGCLHEFLMAFFEVDEVPIRFRPSFFPFTEPSAEADIGCLRDGETVRIGKGDSWLEILGCGMVHPNVLKNVGIDPNEYQGFAFGVGIERLAMLKYGAPDLRNFFDSDIRWLQHYGFHPLLMPTIAGGLS